MMKQVEKPWDYLNQLLEMRYSCCDIYLGETDAKGRGCPRFLRYQRK